MCGLHDCDTGFTPVLVKVSAGKLGIIRLKRVVISLIPGLL